MKKNKIIGLLAMTTMLAFPSFKSSQAFLSTINLNLEGQIPTTCSLVIDQNLFSFNPTSAQTDLTVGTITEACNVNYAVTVTGFDGSLSKAAETGSPAGDIAYTLKYDDISITSDNQTLTTVSSSINSIALNKFVTISTTAPSGTLRAGIYSATLAFTMNAI